MRIDCTYTLWYSPSICTMSCGHGTVQGVIVKHFKTTNVHPSAYSEKLEPAASQLSFVQLKDWKLGETVNLAVSQCNNKTLLAALKLNNSMLCQFFLFKFCTKTKVSKQEFALLGVGYVPDYFLAGSLSFHSLPDSESAFSQNIPLRQE